MATLEIEDLHVEFATAQARQMAVRGVSLRVEAAECVGIVGESGSGKTQLFMAVMGLLPSGARVSGSVRFEGAELLRMAPPELNRVRGTKLTMVFQDPMMSLTPHLKIGVQLAEILVTHTRCSWDEARRGALRMLERVRIADAGRRLDQYPHELSGGMRQRVMIGMSLLCGPSLLIADEPTTALDVTVQAQLMDVLRAMRAESRMATVLISHDLGVVAGLADRILVMYGGRLVESAPAAPLLRSPAHPYTAELLKCVPNLWSPRLARMPTLPGVAPSAAGAEHGCAFAPRCPRVGERCRDERPLLREVAPSVLAACHHPVSHDD